MAGVDESKIDPSPVMDDAPVAATNGQNLNAQNSNAQSSNGQSANSQVSTAQTPTPPAQTTVRAPEPMTPDANYRLVPAPSAPASAPAPTVAPTVAPPATERSGRNFVRPLVVLLLLIVIGVGYWWLTTTGWTPPWVTAPGPLTASGTLEADEVLVASEIPGRIVELVNEGQSVQADEVVAKLDDKLIQLQILQANVATRQQLDIQLDRYQLRSPLTGVVTRVPIHIGEVVAPGQTVAALADLSTLDLTAYVLEKDLGQVLVGQQVAVTADPFPGRTFHGVVTSTNPHAEFTPRNIQTQADRLNLVFGVKIRVENPDGALKPGMPADVIFPPLPAGN